MKNQNQVFNAILHIFNRYARRLKRLITHGLNPERQKVLEKRLNKLLSKLNSFPRALKRTVSIASLIGVTAITQPNAAIAQNFRPPVFNPFGIPSDFTFGEIEFVDIDNDGDKDLFATRLSSNDFNDYFFENIGSPTQPQFDETPLINPFGLLLGNNIITDFADIDGDGDFDLFSKSDFFENIGTANEPNFDAIQINPFSLNMESGSFTPKFIDIDADGDLDYALPVYDYYEVYLKFYENNGTVNAATFDTAPFLSDYFYVSDFQFGDVDNDGDFDVLGLYNFFLSEELVYKENIGNANVPNFDVEEINAYNLPSYEYASYIDFELVDLNNDGNLDLVTSGDSNFDLLFFENEDEESCQQVENLAVIEKTNGYRLTWQALEGSTKCQIKGGKISNSNYTTTYTKFGNEPSSVFLNFSQIKPNSPYFYQVRCDCGVNNDFGPYSFPHFFNTGSHPFMNSAKSENENIFGVESNIATKRTNVKLFPNPANGSFVINTDLENYNFELTDVTGKLVYNQNNINQTSFNFDIKNIEAGTYFVKISNASSSEVVKLMVY
jgi:Secretion system C-terminal sorting domain